MNKPPAVFLAGGLIPAPSWSRFEKTIIHPAAHSRIGYRAIPLSGLVAGIGVSMIEDLLSLRAMVVSHEDGLRDLFRRAASISVLPTEIVDGGDGAVLPDSGADLVYLDGALPPDHAARLVGKLRAAPKPPFIALLAGGGATTPFEAQFAADGLAGRPSRIEEAKWLLDRSLRVRLTTRVLVVDDSATMRSIVRKTLMATRFPLEMGEASDGAAAIDLVRDDDFDVIFIDQNMPDVSGLETLARIKTVKPDVTAVIMTSTSNDELAADARALGAAFLKKPFFPADIENVLCGFYGLRALNPKGR
jgi:CheY-like chemotaxis protein